MPRGSQQPHPLLDWLLAEHSIKNDRALADKLGMDPPNLSRVRHGRAVGATLLLAAHETFGHPVKVLRERMAA